MLTQTDIDALRSKWSQQAITAVQTGKDPNKAIKSKPSALAPAMVKDIHDTIFNSITATDEDGNLTLNQDTYEALPSEVHFALAPEWFRDIRLGGHYVKHTPGATSLAVYPRYDYLVAVDEESPAVVAFSFVINYGTIPLLITNNYASAFITQVASQAKFANVEL